MSIQICSPELIHVESIVLLVNRYAVQNITLPRTEEDVRNTLDDWVVAIDTASPRGSCPIVDCGSLVPLTDELAEIRSLAIAENQQGKGIGSKLVMDLVQMARNRNFAQVCALTLREGFFVRLGFTLVDRWSISPKVWQACIYCAKFHCCDEVAVLMHLSETQSVNKSFPQEAWKGLLKWSEWQPLRLAYRNDANQKK
ncbi:GNAT family N-acetyltransferase [Chloroflexi bacterium TSY]|nr:GNAT family N-acetyltransferase [Chloroflexi bacterium TSY]